jgi:prepilin-type N-terminal cleavage/methylation domain-containing protein
LKILFLKHSGGFGLIEIIVASAIISITVYGLVTATVISSRLVQENLRKTQASFILEETLEVTRILRDQSWDTNMATLSSGTNYYLDFDTSTQAWSIGTTPNDIDGIFTRILAVEEVCRDDLSDDITTDSTPCPTGTYEDSGGTKKFTATVSWSSNNGSFNQSASTYITNIFDN